MPTKTIFLIHGLLVSKHSWEPWVARYSSKGYKVITPAYDSELDKPFEELKKTPDNPILKTITLTHTLDYLAALIRELDEKPIIMGHSFGGLLTQHLLYRGLGVAGVSIDGVPPAGLFPTQWSLIKSAWPGLNPFVAATQPYQMTFTQFRVHTLPLQEQKLAYDTLMVPESRGLYRSGLSKGARVDFTRSRPPLLIVAGDSDHIVPASLSRADYNRNKKFDSTTDFKVFPGRTHYTVIRGQGWEEVADFSLNWAIQSEAMAAKTT